MRSISNRLCVAALLAIGCDEDPTLDQLEIIGGGVSSCYEQAVSVVSWTSQCSGVVIGSATGEQYVLTAAHCVVLDGEAREPRWVNGMHYSARPSAVYVHPGYQKCRPAGVTFAGTSSTDLAVIKLETPILSDDAQPATIADELPPVGTSLDVIGYGASPRPDGERKIGRFRFDGVNPDSSFNVSGLDAGICGGDSGGPAFLQGSPCSHPPPPVIAGIVSSQPLGSPQGGCETGNASVMAHPGTAHNRQFINSVLDGTATPFSSSQIPSCCDPGTAVRTCPDGRTLICPDNGETPSCSQPPPGPRCGDGVCNGGEQCSTCASDCQCCSPSECAEQCSWLGYCGSCSFYGDWGQTEYQGVCFGSTCHCQELWGSCTPC